MLDANVFPKLERLCQRQGFQFQAIDLRWGVSSEAGLDHRTMRICFDELKRAQEISPEPNFLILLGDRYGWRPLPEEISHVEFDLLKEYAKGKNKNQPEMPGIHGKSSCQILEDWYRCDHNIVLDYPPVTSPDHALLNYILQPRTQNLRDGRNYTPRKDDPTKDTQDWIDVQQVLWRIINAAFPVELLNHRFHREWDQHLAEVNAPKHPKRAIPQIARFQASATEQEIWCGTLSALNANNHVIACYRDITNRDDFNTFELSEFYNLKESGEFDSFSSTCQSDMKAAIRHRLGENVPISIPFNRLKREHDKLAIEATETTTKKFCDDVFNRIKPIVERQIEEYWEKSKPSSPARTARELNIERDEHKRFGTKRGGEKSFVGRKFELQVIHAYLKNHSHWPLVIHGASGCGKTALLSRAFELIPENQKPIIRFIGTTPYSSDIRNLLLSLCQELRQHHPSDGSLPTEVNELRDEFDQHLRSATPEQSLILFLDALDQLSDADGGRLLNWIPQGQLRPHVKLVVSCLSNRAEDESSVQPWIELQKRQLPAENIINLDVLSEPEAKTLLFDRLLNQEGRTVSREQRECVEQSLALPVCRQPIYLKLLFEEVRLWRSYDDLPEIGKDLPALLHQLFNRLSLEANHGHLLVERVLGYLASSRHGLTENEILEILFADSKYKEKLNEDNKRNLHELPASATRIPISIWSRLRFDLAPYLTERAAPGANVLTFYHRQVAEWVQEHFAKPADQSWQPHQRLAVYFRNLADPDKNQTWKGESTRPFLEMPHHLSHSNCEELTTLLFDFSWLQEKTNRMMVQELLLDFSECLSAISANHSKRKEIALLQGALRLSSHVISKDGSQLSGQLLGRLLESDTQNIQTLLKHARSFHELPCLLPTTRSLFSPSEPDAIHCLAIINSGTALLSSGSSGAITTRNLLTGRIENYIETGYRTCILKIAPLKHDNYVVIASIYPHELRVVDVTSGETVSRLEGHRDRVNDIAVTPDGSLFFTASSDKTILVWSASSTEPLSSLIGHKTGVLCVAISADGRYAYSGSADGEIIVWAIPDFSKLSVLHSNRESVTSLAAHPLQRKIVSGHEDGSIAIWSVDRCEETLTFRKHKGMISALRIGSDGMYLFSSSSDRSIIVWHFNSGMIRNTLTGHSSKVNDIALTPDGRFVVSASSDRIIRIWDYNNANRSARTRTQEHSTNVFAIGISPNGGKVMSGDAKGQLINWNFEDGNNRASFQLNNKEITAIKFSPDGSKAVASSYDGTVRTIDFDAGRPDKTFWLNIGQISAIAITPTLDSIIVGTSMGLVARINFCNESILWKKEAGIRGITDVDVSANGEYIATASFDGAVEISSARTGERIRCIYPNLPRNVLALSMHKVIISKDITCVLSACEDGSVCCWDWNTGKLAHRFVGHKGVVTGLGIDNSCSLLYSASEDATVKVWDFMRNQVIAEFTAEGPVCSCAASSAGDKIAIGEQSGRIHFLKYNHGRIQ